MRVLTAPLRVLVCGGRDFTDKDKVNTELTALYKQAPIKDNKVDFCIIQGGAHGADRLAKEWAEWRYLPVETFEADWKTHGKAAGPLRNQVMLDEGRPDLVLAFPGGRGTADMVARARKANVDVKVID